MPRLILVRHGQSQWNLENRFTGWWDVDLTAQGEAKARAAGALLAEKGLLPTVAFTSFQTRAIKTLHLALEAAGRIRLHGAWFDIAVGELHVYDEETAGWTRLDTPDTGH